MTTKFGGPNKIPQIYADDIDKGLRLPYFYLHGKVERANGYDCCKGDQEAFYLALSAGITLCEIHNNDKSVHDGLMFVKYDRDLKHMNGLIVTMDDHESIIEIKNNSLYSTNTMYEHQKDILRNIYPKVYDMLFKGPKEVPTTISIVPVLQDNPIVLIPQGMYRDGGSRDLKGNDGVIYFQDRSISSRMSANNGAPSTLGRVFAGNINAKVWPEPLNIGSYYIREDDGTHSF